MTPTPEPPTPQPQLPSLQASEAQPLLTNSIITQPQDKSPSRTTSPSRLPHIMRFYSQPPPSTSGGGLEANADHGTPSKAADWHGGGGGSPSKKAEASDDSKTSVSSSQRVSVPKMFRERATARPSAATERPNGGQQSTFGSSTSLCPLIGGPGGGGGGPTRCPSLYSYCILQGNNSLLIRQVLRLRPWWTPAEEGDEGLNLLWGQFKSPAFFSLLKTTPNGAVPAPLLPLTVPPSPPLPRICNHFEGNAVLCTKRGLANTMIDFYTSQSLDPFSVIPLTFIIRRDGCKDPEFIAFRKFFQALEREAAETNAAKRGRNAAGRPLSRAASRSRPASRPSEEESTETGGEDKQESEDKGEQSPGKRKRGQANGGRGASYRFRNLWIVKPGEYSNRGNGIKITNRLEDVEMMVGGRDGKSTIIQKYIERPFLVHGRKFDIRVYGLMVEEHRSAQEVIVRAYMYRDGYLRTSSETYRPDCFDRMIHLTNDAVQKKSESYGRFEAANKLSYAEFQKYLDTCRPKDQVVIQEHLVTQMQQIMADTFRAAAANMNTNRRQHSFEIFGYDFMVDESNKVWLLEINTNPCLELSSAWLAHIIPLMIEHTIRVAVDPLFPPPPSHAHLYSYATSNRRSTISETPSSATNQSDKEAKRSQGGTSASSNGNGNSPGSKERAGGAHRASRDRSPSPVASANRESGADVDKKPTAVFYDETRWQLLLTYNVTSTNQEEIAETRSAEYPALALTSLNSLFDMKRKRPTDAIWDSPLARLPFGLGGDFRVPPCRSAERGTNPPADESCSSCPPLAVVSPTTEPATIPLRPGKYTWIPGPSRRPPPTFPLLHPPHPSPLKPKDPPPPADDISKSAGRPLPPRRAKAKAPSPVASDKKETADATSAAAAAAEENRQKKPAGRSSFCGSSWNLASKGAQWLDAEKRNRKQPNVPLASVDLPPIANTDEIAEVRVAHVCEDPSPVKEEIASATGGGQQETSKTPLPNKDTTETTVTIESTATGGGISDTTASVSQPASSANSPGAPPPSDGLLKVAQGPLPPPAKEVTDPEAQKRRRVSTSILLDGSMRAGEEPLPFVSTPTYPVFRADRARSERHDRRWKPKSTTSVQNSHEEERANEDDAEADRLSDTSEGS
ncbi:unnamed protein product [Vitrella brassicaformis CCMP3155]|uniref:Uncharacterized protein n=2 Tax=Vitrella brassicaformis TaxID=1169539 RepID=A0A0G4G063_VITBC|nr:unnamed protein product [Vitrella brassicaformis CCMP3155]|eukprot:CEM20907.1 unnamed protein product [Vitrella brassicaformis CCMP3155]